MWPRDSPRCGPGTPRAGLAPAILSAEPRECPELSPPRAGAAFTGLLVGDLFKSCKNGSEISEILFHLLLCHCGGGAKQ